MMDFSKKARAAVVVGLAMFGGCKSPQPRVQAGSKEYQSTSQKASEERMVYGFNLHERHLENYSKKLKDIYENSPEANKALRAARFALVLSEQGKHAEAEKYFLYALGRIEARDETTMESFLSRAINRTIMQNYRGAGLWELAAFRAEFAYSLINQANQLSGRERDEKLSMALASLRGSIEYESNPKQAPVKPAAEAGEKTEAAPAKIEEYEAGKVYPSATAIVYCTVAAKIALKLGDKEEAAKFLETASNVDKANVAFGLASSTIPTLDQIAACPIIIRGSGDGPAITRTGNKNQFRVVVGNKNGKFKISLKSGSGQPLQPLLSVRSDLTHAATIEPPSKFDETAEAKEIRADARFMGFQLKNETEVLLFPPRDGTQQVALSVDEGLVGVRNGTMKFLRNGDKFDINFAADAITTQTVRDDYPASKEEEDKKRAENDAKAPKKKSGFEKVLDKLPGRK